MKIRLNQVVFIFILSLTFFNNKFSYSIFTLFTFVSVSINPLFGLIFIPSSIYLNLFIPYVCFLLFTLLTFFLKTNKYRITINYFTTFFLILAIFFKTDNVSNFITSLILTTILLPLLFYLNNNIKDERIFKPILLGISLGFLFFSHDKLIISLLIASTITNPIQLVIPIFLIFFNFKIPILEMIIILEITALNFLKRPFPFFVLISFFISYFYQLNILFILALIYPIINFITIETLPEVKTNPNSYLNYLEKLRDDKTNYEAIDNNIKELIKTFCTNCNNKSVCFKKNRLYLYQYLMYQSTSNMKISQNFKEFVDNCEYRAMMDERVKLNFLEIRENKNLSLLIDHTKKHDVLTEKLISFFKKSSYHLETIENQSRGSISFKFQFKEDYIALNLLNFRLNKLLAKPVILKKENNSFSLEPKPKFKVSFDSIVLAKGNIYISGDNILIKEFKSDIYFALSDGMGSGLKAFEASKNLLKKLEALIDLGMDDESLMKHLKHIYEIAGYNDTYGTLDFIHIVKDKLTASLYKVASSNTYQIAKNKLLIYKTDTLPLEMSGDMTSHILNLNLGDTIILASDGLSEVTDIKNVTDYIKAISHKDANKIVYELAKFIYDESKCNLKDDISIIAIKLMPIN